MEEKVKNRGRKAFLHFVKFLKETKAKKRDKSREEDIFGVIFYVAQGNGQKEGQAGDKK